MYFDTLGVRYGILSKKPQVFALYRSKTSKPYVGDQSVLTPIYAPPPNTTAGATLIVAGLYKISGIF